MLAVKVISTAADGDERESSFQGDRVAAETAAKDQRQRTVEETSRLHGRLLNQRSAQGTIQMTTNETLDRDHLFVVSAFCWGGLGVGELQANFICTR
jgi:hypothetical protein